MSDAAREMDRAVCGACAAWRSSALDAGSWAYAPVAHRVRVLRKARERMAARAEEFAHAFSPDLPRSLADSLIELNTLLDGIRFLERNAQRLLKPRKLGMSGRPMWLTGVHAEVHREPLGHVLVIGPSNYPLFLPGAQVMQALAAGNRVTWKPGAGGRPVAELVASALRDAGLPDGLLRVTDESVEAAQLALESRPDKVVFTGSAASGRMVLRTAAEHVVPAVVELSGADALIVLPGADLEHVARAAAYGLRLNGGQVCMSPRRLFAEEKTMGELRPLLLRELEKVPPVRVNARTAALLQELTRDAVSAGATLLYPSAACSPECSPGQPNAEGQQPLLIDQAAPSMAITRSDVFAPVLSLLPLRSLLELPEAYAACTYALTAAIFCARRDETKARKIAQRLRAGTVLINDLIAPTGDPRVPFGGRGESGYGVTRGAEGLLEMTAVKTLLVRRRGWGLHLDPLSDEDAPLFAGLVRATHAGTWKERWAGVRTVIKAAPRRLKQKEGKGV